MIRHHPLSVCTYITLSPRPSPSAFAYCKLSKTGGRNGLGMRLELEAGALGWSFRLYWESLGVKFLGYAGNVYLGWSVANLR